MTKHYLTQNLSVPVKTPAGKTYEFGDCGYFGPTNSNWGIFASDNSAEQADLDALVSIGLIEACTEEDYGKLNAKKKLKPTAVNSYDLQSTRGYQPTGNGRVGPAVVVEADSRVAPEPEPLDDIVTPAKPTRKAK